MSCVCLGGVGMSKVHILRRTPPCGTPVLYWLESVAIVLFMLCNAVSVEWFLL